MKKTKGKKILLIERHDVFRESLTELLTLKNYQVLNAPNGSLGLNLIKKHAPDLVICARSFSDCNCWQILQEMRKVQLLTPFVFLSSKPASDEHLAMMQQANVFTIVKPFPTEELTNLIQKYFAQTSIPVTWLVNRGGA